MILMIDNYDSFTYNLVHYLQELGAQVSVYFNDKIHLSDIAQLKPQHIILSPGPGRPEHAGIMLDLIKQFAGKIPILGVCLGHQAIAHAFGANIIAAHKVMHGKVSKIYHKRESIFRQLQSPFDATRYHSLVVDAKTLPCEFKITAWTQKEKNDCHEIMGIQHRHYFLAGVQFHPESILTKQGHQLLQNFLEYQQGDLGAAPNIRP